MYITVSQTFVVLYLYKSSNDECIQIMYSSLNYKR